MDLGSVRELNPRLNHALRLLPERLTPLHLVSTRRTRPHWQEGWVEADDMLTGPREDLDDDMSSRSQEDLDDMSSPQQYAELARLLLEHGADVTGQDKDGRTPFDLASSDSGYEEVAHVLLEHGAVPGTQENMD
jgi:ankyrin repeat protein